MEETLEFIIAFIVIFGIAGWLISLKDSGNPYD